ncbi:hypothetical protein ENSA7_72550 [Enhygromyxa salina]|uniref:Uncharacterized protein n=1 Tax=Enhygromyxa salina TaxID=215803 RepID=A0A2S9XUM6_9BACT|nr:hypothetical protein ENSA7_72550 [Enhygromyxa salina]
MPALVTSILVGWIVAGGLAVAIHGFSGGGWIGGLLWGIIGPALTLYEWASLRKASPDMKHAADRMLLAWGMLLLALAIPAIDAVGARVCALLSG